MASNITRAKQITEDERFMGIPPWIVAGVCFQCGKPVEVRTYGAQAELRESKLCYKDCNDGR